MDPEMVLNGAIVDSWVEPAGPSRRDARVVLQVSPKGRPGDLMIVEAEASLVPDGDWLEDLGANLCHGNLVAVAGRRTLAGLLLATRLQFAR